MPSGDIKFWVNQLNLNPDILSGENLTVSCWVEDCCHSTHTELAHGVVLALPGLSDAVVELIPRALRLHVPDDRVGVLVDLALDRGDLGTQAGQVGVGGQVGQVCNRHLAVVILQGIMVSQSTKSHYDI